MVALSEETCEVYFRHRLSESFLYWAIEVPPVAHLIILKSQLGLPEGEITSC